MNRVWGIIALVAVFAVSGIGAALLTDVLRDDRPQTSVAAPMPAASIGDTDIAGETGEFIPVLSPIWVDVHPQPGESEPDAVPPGAVSAADGSVTGIQAIQPTDGSAIGPPDETAGATDPVDPTDAEDAVPEPESPGTDDRSQAIWNAETLEAARMMSEYRSNHTRFIDPCTTLADGACPPGAAALVVLGSDDAFPLIASVFRGPDGRFGRNGEDYCPAGFDAGDYNIWFLTMQPATIEFSYGTSHDEAPFSTATIAAPEPGDDEYDRWVANGAAGTIDPDEASTWVRACASLDLDAGTIYTFTPIVARTSDGQVTELGWVPSLDTRPPSGSAGRPPMSIITRGDSHVTATVRIRNPADGYRSIAWPIDTSEPDAPSCTDIEQDVVDGTLTWHPDVGRNAVAPVLTAEDPPPRAYDPQWSWRQVFDLPLREGRTYTLCAWEVFRGDHTFGRLEVLEREQVEIVTLNRHPVRISLVEIAADGTPPAPSVSVSVVNGNYCADGRFTTVTDVGPDPHTVWRPFCETLGFDSDSVAFIATVVAPDILDTIAVPLHPAQGCEADETDPTCFSAFSEYFATSSSTQDSCEYWCGTVTTRFRVDYLPSNGHGSDRWHVTEPGTFTGVDPGSGHPDVNFSTMELAPVPDRTDALQASFELSRPSTYELHISPRSRSDGCGEAVISGEGESHVEVTFEDLCPNTMYLYDSIDLEDAAGETWTQPLTGKARGAWTNGYASYLDMSLRLRHVDEAVAVAYCRELDEAYAADIDDRCWEQIGISPASRISMGGTPATAADPTACVGSGASISRWFAPALANRHARVALHGDAVLYDIHAILEMSPHCGSSLPGGAFHSVLDYHFHTPITDLDEPQRFVAEEHGIAWEIELKRTDRGIANRQG